MTRYLAFTAVAVLVMIAPVRADTYAPQVADVIEAAYRANNLDRDPVRGLIRRARIGWLVPWLTVRTGRNTSWQDPIAAASAVQQSATDVDHGTTIEVRATWRLDRLIFDGREMQLAAVDTARRRERRRLAVRVIRTYFAWKRAVTGTVISASADPEDATPRIRAARAEEAAAELDALTDGWFSTQLASQPSPQPSSQKRPKPGQRASP